MAKRRSRRNRKRGGETLPLPEVAALPPAESLGGGLTEVAVPAILLYASSKLKKRQPTNKYMSLKSRQILHWRKKAGRTRRTRRTRRR